MTWWEIVLVWVCASPVVCVLASLFMAGAARATAAATEPEPAHVVALPAASADVPADAVLAATA